jgi:hypothetical protein
MGKSEKTESNKRKIQKSGKYFPKIKNVRADFGRNVPVAPNESVLNDVPALQGG